MGRKFFNLDRLLTVVTDKNSFHAPVELGKTRRMTPEGYLLCEGVAIARVGEQKYHKSELPLEADANDEILVQRVPEEVFNAQAMASFEGKSVTVEHPNEFIKPGNYKDHEIGTTHNVRRGEGIEDDMVIADLLIKDQKAIEYVNKYKPEVSCGYDSEYDQTEPGHAVQRSIRGNHVALVDRGRAGPRCAIRDHDLLQEIVDMGKRTKVTASVSDRFMRFLTAFRANDAAGMAKELEETTTQDSDGGDDDEDDKTMDAITSKNIDKYVGDAMDRYFAKRTKDAEEKAAKEKEMKDAWEKEEKEKDDKKKAEDALEAEKAPPVPDLGVLHTGDSMKNILARAEILSPGIQVPTADAVTKDKSALNKLMLASVQKAYQVEDSKKVLDIFLDGNPITAVTVDNVPSIFNGAAELMRRRNNFDGSPQKLTTKDFGKATTVADVAKLHNDFWAPRLGQ